MKLEKGLVFKKYYRENNINNIPRCEVRGIVDNEIIVLLCTSKSGSQYYKSIEMDDFLYNEEAKVYIPLK